ncbi:MAG: hypothetical protein LUC24_02145, partial [Bacteroidales bacterium]|nr:hypothetical protein [Bacteroidales bacterium]
GGIVTSGTIQVAGSEDAVLAGMTGNGTKDTSVRFWAGGTFDERADAPFRVRQDGSMYSTKGNIGGFTIGESDLTAENSVYGKMLLSDALLKFTHPSSDGNIDSEAYIGANSFWSGSYTFGPIRLIITHENLLQANVGLSISVEGATKSDTDGYQYTGNHALRIDKGDICGFRLKTRRVSTSQTLTIYDSIIMSTATTAITLTLPSDAEDGQMYFIRKVMAGNITITGGTIVTSYGTTATKVTIEYGQLAIFIYDQSYDRWTANYMDNMS